MTWRRRRDRTSEQLAPRPTPEVAPTPQAFHPGEAALFDSFEACMRGAGTAEGLRDQASVVSRVLELANDDWPEPDAVRELLRLVAGEQRVLERTQRVLQGGLLRTMLPNVTAIRASRLVRAALRQARAADRW